MSKSPFITYSSLVLTMFLWGGTFIAGRMLGSSVPPTTTALLRFVVASVTLIIILRLTHGHIPKPKKDQLPWLFFLGLSGIFAYNLFFFEGLKHINAGRASLIIASTPLCIAAAATFFFREKMTGLKFSGIMLSLVGAIFVISNGHPTEIFKGGFGPGEKAFLGCVASWTAYTLAGRKVLNKIAPLTAVCFSCIIGTLLLSVPALHYGFFNHIKLLTFTDWCNITYLGVAGTAIGFWWYYRAIKAVGAGRAGIFINLVPVFALLQAGIFLGESIKLSVLAGGILVLAGVSLTNMKKK